MNETYNSTTDNGWKAWNQWHLNVLEEEVTNVWFFFLVIFASGIWLIYLTFYNSRNAMIRSRFPRSNDLEIALEWPSSSFERFIGWIFSKVISHFYNKNGNHLSFDSFSFNFLGGKIMVRNLRYANTDYSVTVNDGYIIFRWWLPHPIGMIEMLSRDRVVEIQTDFGSMEGYF